MTQTRKLTVATINTFSMCYKLIIIVIVINIIQASSYWSRVILVCSTVQESVNSNIEIGTHGPTIFTMRSLMVTKWCKSYG